MQREPRIDLVRLFEWLHARGVRYVLIGGQAVRVYGSRRVTQDIDLWVHPAARRSLLQYLEATFDADLSADPDGPPRPLVQATAGLDCLDLLFARSVHVPGGPDLDLDEVVRRGVVRSSPQGARVRVPCIQDLILLKRLRTPPTETDALDIRFLEAVEHGVLHDDPGKPRP